VRFVREQRAPALLRLTVPRLEGHSAQDTQTYKSEDEIASEWARDPLPKLKAQSALSDRDWAEIEREVTAEVAAAVAEAEIRGVSNPEHVTDHVFFQGQMQEVGGRAGLGIDGTSSEPRPEGQRINMVTAIRRTLEQEIDANPKVLVFGEDVGPKGGVHAVTLGLQEKFGVERVSEPATEQIHDCGTMRWRTNNRFAAPMVLRVPGGFFKCGDPWHSMTNEVEFVHNPGWKVAVPSNAEDAVGLLRGSLRGNDPVIFFEHRAMLDDSWARRPWPGDSYVLPFGKAKKTREGDRITIVTWGAMVPRCEAASEGVSADVIDLRTLMPWDREMVLESVRRTRRCLIVHEDLRTGGFGAEIAAVVADEGFLDLDAPVARVTMPDIPSPHHPKLLEWAVPSVERIRAEIERLVGF
jgi:2-oxoisovalerate dehydrogenase E1 component